MLEECEKRYLKPCPFCGEKKKIGVFSLWPGCMDVEKGDSVFPTFVKCGNCLSTTRVFYGFGFVEGSIKKSKEEAIAAWNMRQP